MKKVFSFFLAVSVLTTSFGAFTVAPSSNSVTGDKKMAKVSKMYDEALADGNLTYAEVKSIAEFAKGSKLSLKEKLALKVAKKQLAKKANNGAASGKSQLVALLLVALVGSLGIHRFYLGYTWQGIVQLLTLGGCGIWSLIDLIRIITGNLGPKDGSYEKTL